MACRKAFSSVTAFAEKKTGDESEDFLVNAFLFWVSRLHSYTHTKIKV